MRRIYKKIIGFKALFSRVTIVDLFSLINGKRYDIKPRNKWNQAVACRSKKRNAELVFFVRCAMFLHFGITITQPNAKFLKNSASDFE